MKKLSRFFRYFQYYFELPEKKIQALAIEAARNYYASRPLRTAQYPNPHPVDYERRRNEFQAFQRAFKDSYRHNYAKTKLGK